jgi:hypothetical protein
MRRAGNLQSIAAVLGAVLLGAGIAFAQQGGQGGQGGKPPAACDMVSRMKQDLDLTAEQVSQITPVIENEINQMQALIDDGADRDAARVKMDALRQSTDEALSQYFTPAQLTLWKSRQRQPPQDKSGSMGAPFGEPKP